MIYDSICLEDFSRSNPSIDGDSDKMNNVYQLGMIVAIFGGINHARCYLLGGTSCQPQRMFIGILSPKS